MSEAVLFLALASDDEEITPLETFIYPDGPPKHYLRDVNSHLTNILQLFVVDALKEDSAFWVADRDSFYPEEVDYDGPVYAELKSDAEINLPLDTYAAARIVADYIVKSNDWDDFIVAEEIKLQNISMNDIPLTAPEVATTPPVDPRFDKQGKVFNKHGVVYTYGGIIFDPINPRLNKLAEFASSKSVRIGIENNDYVSEKTMKQFLASEDSLIEIYPLPVSYNIGVRKPLHKNWFARIASRPGVEGLGKTEDDAKRDLAMKVAFADYE